MLSKLTNLFRRTSLFELTSHHKSALSAVLIACVMLFAMAV
jgi:hypothetical protein